MPQSGENVPPDERGAKRQKTSTGRVWGPCQFAECVQKCKRFLVLEGADEKCGRCQHGKGYHKPNLPPKDGFTKCEDPDCKGCQEFAAGRDENEEFCLYCEHFKSDHKATTFWVDQGEKKVAFGPGTTVAMVKQRCLDEQQRKVAHLLDENGVVMVQLELGRTYQAILEPVDEKRSAEEESARVLVQDEVSSGLLPKEREAMGEGPWSHNGSKVAVYDAKAVVELHLAGGQRSKSFRIDGAPLSRSERGAVYLVDDPEDAHGGPWILRHGAWGQEAESVHVYTHIASLAKLDGRLGHPRLLFYGHVEKLRRGGVPLKALAAVETFEGRALQAGGKVIQLDAYGVCKLGADLTRQLALEEQEGVNQRDMRPSNVLTKACIMRRPGDGGGTQGPRSKMALEGPFSRVPPVLCTSQAACAAPDGPDYKGLTFSLCDFEMASFSGLENQELVLPTFEPLVKDPFFQPHAGMNHLLQVEDSALSLVLVMAVSWGGLHALPWVNEARTLDLEGARRKLEVALNNESEDFGLSAAHPEAGAFAHAAKDAVKTRLKVDLHVWSHRLAQAAEELSVIRAC